MEPEDSLPCSEGPIYWYLSQFITSSKYFKGKWAWL